MSKLNRREFEELLVEWKQNFINEENEPTAIAVLGAPASGKSFNMKKLKTVVDDIKSFKTTLSSGVVVTVDKIRAEVQAMDPVEQLKGFVHAFYYLKDISKKEPNEFGKWFSDIKTLWQDKLNSLITDISISVNDEEILFDNISAIDSIDRLKDIDAKSVIAQLHPYHDYKRITRYFQNKKVVDAAANSVGIAYDESGDEPQKIINQLDKLHDKNYITDAFLIHPENVATNLIMNFYRVLTGGDGGRDSSSAIIDAYNQIEQNRDVYSDNAEESYEIDAHNFNKIIPALKHANIEDDKERGDKPIDVFVRVKTMAPLTAYNEFSSMIKNEKDKVVFNALLKYAYLFFDNMPDDAKSELSSITNSMSKSEALDILKAAEVGGEYKFAVGGINQELIKNAETVLTEVYDIFDKHIKLLQ